VLEEALRASSASIVLAHNHPSGNPAPSPGDDETTRDLDQGARLIGLHLIDHVIIGETDTIAMPIRKSQPSVTARTI